MPNLVLISLTRNVVSVRAVKMSDTALQLRPMKLTIDTACYFNTLHFSFYGMFERENIIVYEKSHKYRTAGPYIGVLVLMHFPCSFQTLATNV